MRRWPIFLAMLIIAGAAFLISFQEFINLKSEYPIGTSVRTTEPDSGETAVRDDLPLTSDAFSGLRTGVWGKIADIQAAYKNREVTTTSNLRDPELLFWLANLYNADLEISSVACSVFEQACQDIEHPSFGDDNPGRVAASVYRTIWTNFTRALMHSENSRLGNLDDASMYQIWNQPEYNELIDFFSQRAQTPEYRDSSTKVLNALTFNLYDDKNIDWWRKEYPKSKLAAIYAGKAQEVWIKLKE